MKKAAQAVFVILILLLLPFKPLTKAAYIKYSQNPVLQYGQNPTVIREDIYKMWYETNYGNGWRINYAYSPDGISNWVIPHQTVIPVGTSDGFEMDMANPNVIYNNSLNLYQMWYTAIGFLWNQPVADRFRLGYATSPDGINWTKHDWVLKGTEGSWDNGGIRGESILYQGGIYKMWYSGTNSIPFHTFHWQIGYATSPDGINWTKENNGQPILTITEPWEQTDISYPNVIYNDGLYEMWYGAGNDYMPFQIVYATSNDGIHWDKPADKNPVITNGPSGSFDSLIISGPSALRLSNGKTMLWYGGDGWKIGLAADFDIPISTSTPLPTPTSTLTPTPSLTPTSTPTPSPISTPTPTPTYTPTPTSPTKKVIIIPGLGASWNKIALLSCNDNNDPWTLLSEAEKLYKPLRDSLQGAGFETYVFPYDWRKQVKDNVNSLSSYINSIAPSENVDLIGHSMGGLVARAYLESKGNNSKVDTLITVGSPHQGVSMAYPLWSAGEVWAKGQFRLGAEVAIHLCRFQYPNKREAVQYKLPSIQNLLPVYDYLRDKVSKQLKSTSQLFAQNNWLPTNSFNPPFFGVHISTISGDNKQTLSIIPVRKTNKLNQLLGNWQDGDPVGKELSSQGDGTVLQLSSIIDGADNHIISKDHGGIINSSRAIREILGILGNPQATGLNIEQVSQELETNMVVIADQATFWVKKPDGPLLQSKDGILVLSDIPSGDYYFAMLPKGNKTQLSIGQFLDDGRVIWKDYSHAGVFPRIGRLRFRKDKPIEDILQ